MGSSRGIVPIATSITALEFTSTCFEKVAARALRQLVAGSSRIEVPAGRPVFPTAGLKPRVGMVLMGTARSFLTAADGRQLTVRYARRGALVGRYSDLSGDHAPLTVQAVTDCTILEFDVDVFTRCAATQISVSTAITEELVRRLEDVYATIGDSAFGSIRQRLVRHLLALARPDSPEDLPVAAISQQELANAIGSSREVVARHVAQLRTEGLIRTGPRQIELLSVERLVGLLGHWRADSPY
jgi:CRP/FNR family transcriptional regulator